MPSDEITSIVKEIVVLSTFPKERGGEKAYSARRGFRSVVRYVFLETGRNLPGLVILCPLAASSPLFSFESLMVLSPRSILIIGHLPPLCFFNSSCSSLNVLLCLDVRSLELCLQPPRSCVFVSCWLHLVHSIGPCELCFFLHL